MKVENPTEMVNERKKKPEKTEVNFNKGYLRLGWVELIHRSGSLAKM